MIPEMIDFQDSKWVVKAKLEGNRGDDHTKLKSMYGCDLILKNNQNFEFLVSLSHENEFAIATVVSENINKK